MIGSGEVRTSTHGVLKECIGRAIRKMATEPVLKTGEQLKGP